MKVTRKKVIFLIVFITVIRLTAFGASAEDTAEYRMPEDFSELLTSLPDEISGRLPSRLFDGDAPTASEGVSELIAPSNLFSLIIELLGVRLSEGKTAFLISLGVLLASAVIRKLSGFTRTDSGVGLVLRLCVYLSFFGFGYSAVSEAKRFFDDVTAFITASVPLVGSAYALGGNVNAAASGSAGLTVALSVCGNIFGKFSIPVFFICLGLSTAGVFREGLDLSGLSACIRKIQTGVAGFTSVVLSASLGMQTVITAKSDSFAMKGARYAAGTVIPIVGGTVAGALGTLSASAEMIRSTIGISAIAIIALMLIPSFLTVMLYRLIFTAVGAFAGVLGCTDEQKLFSEISGLFGYLAAAECVCSLCFVINFAVLAGCASAI